jgi:hypothetical protein
MQSIARHILHVERIIVKFVDGFHLYVLLRLIDHLQQIHSNAPLRAAVTSAFIGKVSATQILLPEHLN